MKFSFLLLFVLSSKLNIAQTLSEKTEKLQVISSLKVYKESIKKDGNKQLLEIKKEIPDVVLDIRYATDNNFMKQVMYSQARAFARKPVIEQLKKIQVELRKKGLGLKIYDAYRPYAITIAFYKKATDKNFVANPAKGSKHNRGCAIDLSLVDFKTKREVPMPTPYDSFAPEAAADFQKLPMNLQKNRNFLIKIMKRYGFNVLKNEWWHYDFKDWRTYEILDIPFKSL
ncbi:M15 family metallopeptidase [Pedobacter nutrimenti]|jgi:D-alanyl-D-alanine dipeptidase|uniref:D-alanyl-D-alanine dipeptidase n=1 Tax=Pedobacter nutrimenti TaxID=1241337 RepID=A0A318UKZ2_9SPHI|nr:M15 family metallopeptidase [Pedobacter nutrimenti]PYF75778.1 D-alanyl-D-alanine dipeptidase [Pedobacter nutrimenti]